MELRSCQLQLSATTEHDRASHYSVLMLGPVRGYAVEKMNRSFVQTQI